MKSVVWSALLCIGIALSCSSLGALDTVASVGAHGALVLSSALAVILPLVLAVTVLAERFPGTLGLRTYTKATLGELPSLALTYVLLTSVVLTGAIEIHYLFAFAGVDEEVRTALAVAGVLVVTVINCAGHQVPKVAQVLLTILLIAVLSVLSANAFDTSRDVASISQVSPSWGQIASAVAGAVFLFTGFEWCAQLNLTATGRVAPTLLLAMLAGLVVLTSIYGGLLLAHSESSGAGVLIAVTSEHAFGRTLLLVVAVAAALSTLNGGLMGAARLLYAIAREGRFSSSAKKISSSGVPVGATLWISASALIGHLVLRGNAVREAALAVGIVYMFVYAGLAAAAAKLLADAPRPAHWLQHSGVRRAVRLMLLGDAALLALVAAGGLVVLCLENAVAGWIALAIVLLAACAAYFASHAVVVPHRALERRGG
jgi:amino acid transporter